MTHNNNKLFELYIVPNLGEIKSLTRYYTLKPDDVNDNYQEILLELFKYIHTYNNTKSLKTWLHIAVKRYCLNHYRKNTITLEKTNEKVLLIADDCQEYDYDKELFVNILNPTEKRVLYYLMQGYGKTEICKVLHLTECICTKHINEIRLKYYRYFKAQGAFITKKINCAYLRKKTLKTNEKKKTYDKYAKLFENKYRNNKESSITL